VPQVDKSGEESLVHFAEIVRGKKQTVEILCRELAKSRQPSDLTKKRGGYDWVAKVQA
jgi:hypothetical protein